jgi:peptide deformylase
MSVLELADFDSPQLSSPAVKVLEVTPEIIALAADLVATMLEMPSCVALSANQVEHPLWNSALFVYRSNQGPHCIVNPAILSRELYKLTKEGCSSLPGISFEVTRARQVHLTGTDLDGDEIDVTMTDPMTAQVYQHEVAHLTGKTILDMARQDERKQAIHRLRRQRTRVSA